MRIFYDVDTQNDFMNADGALYVKDAEMIKPNLRMLTRYARENFIPIFGSVDLHFGTPKYQSREGELAIWGGPFPNHCMDGECGQRKILETTPPLANLILEDKLDKGIYLPNMFYFGFEEKIIPDEVREEWEIYKKYTKKTLEEFWNECRQDAGNDYIDLALEEIKMVNEKKKAPFGVFFEKQHYDVFTNPVTDVVLEKANVTEAIVYGVATDFCVRAAVIGMQQRGVQCYVVEDAVKGVFPDKTKIALEEMLAAGAKFVTTKQVLDKII